MCVLFSEEETGLESAPAQSPTARQTQGPEVPHGVGGWVLRQRCLLCRRPATQGTRPLASQVSLTWGPSCATPAACVSPTSCPFTPGFSTLLEAGVMTLAVSGWAPGFGAPASRTQVDAPGQMVLGPSPGDPSPRGIGGNCSPSQAWTVPPPPTSERREGGLRAEKRGSGREGCPVHPCSSEAETKPPEVS